MRKGNLVFGVLSLLVAAGGLLSGPGLAAESSPVSAASGPVLLGADSFLRCYAMQMTEQVRGKDGQLKTFRVRRINKSRVKLTPLSSEKAMVLPAPPDKNWTTPKFDDFYWVRVRGKMRFLHAQTGLLCLRGKFRLKNPTTLKLNVSFQGGAIVFINGKEIARSHLPKGKISAQTPATDYPKTAYVHDDGKSKGHLLYHSPYALGKSGKEFEQRVRHIKNITVPASMLRSGLNVLAVEIHRAPGAAFMYRARRGSQWARAGFNGLTLTAPLGSNISASSGRPQGLQAWNVGVTDNLTPRDFGDPSEVLRPVRVTGPGNGAYSALLALGSVGPIKGLAVKVSALKGPGGSLPASAVLVRYGGQAPRMSNYARYPENFGALLETVPSEVKVLGDSRGRKVQGYGAVQPVWFTVRVPGGTRPGLYKGQVRISTAGNSSITVPLEATVIDWTLPDPLDFSTIVGCFQSPDSLAAYYDVKMWSEKHWALIGKSLKLMGEMGVKTLYITAQRQTHLGNQHSMIRWEKSSDGKLKPDLSIAEKYLALAVKHMGKVPMVGLYCWEINAPDAGCYPSHLSAKQRREFEREVLITVRDPKTGKLSEAKGPAWGSPGSREFWKPVIDGLKAILSKHGIADSLMLGVAGDYKPSDGALKDLKELTGGAKWILHSHNIRHLLGSKFEYPVGYIAAAWGGHAKHCDPDQGRGYGWKSPIRRVMTRGFDRNTPCQRTMLEFLVTGIATPKKGATYKPDYGLRGVGRCGADFWPVLKSAKGRRGQTLFGRYPETLWGQLNVFLWSPAFFAPGRDGAVATVRSEMLRENLQEIEARVFIEKALEDKATCARLGSDLARSSRQLLDARVRLFMPRDAFTIRSASPERMAAELYRKAAAVAAKLGVK
jgi:glycosyl hydrolase family 123